MSIWWAAALGGLLYYLLGAAWFTPLFGRSWDRSIGYDRSRNTGRFPLGYYLLPLAGALVTTVVIAAIYPPGGGVGAGLVSGAGVGIAAAAASFTNALTPHTAHPYVFGAITAGYHLTGATLAGLTIGLLS